MKHKNATLSGTIAKSNRNIIERNQIDARSKQIHDHSLSFTQETKKKSVSDFFNKKNGQPNGDTV